MPSLREPRSLPRMSLYAWTDEYAPGMDAEFTQAYAAAHGYMAEAPDTILDRLEQTRGCPGG